MRISDKRRAREDKAYAFIRAILAERGYAPTRRELLLHLGQTSTSSADITLAGLVRRGLIEVDARRAGGIRVVALAQTAWERRLEQLAAKVALGPPAAMANVALVRLAVEAIHSNDPDQLLALAVQALARLDGEAVEVPTVPRDLHRPYRAALTRLVAAGWIA